MSCDTTIDLVIGGKIDAVKAAMEWQAKKTKKWQEIQNSNEDRNEEWLSRNGFKDHREYVTWGMDYFGYEENNGYAMCKPVFLQTRIQRTYR